MYIQYLGEIVPPPHHNAMGVRIQVTFLNLYYPSSRPLSHLDVIKVPDIVDLTANFQFLNLRFQKCFLFVPEMFASMSPYIVQIIYIALARIFYPLHFSLLPLI
jgi:hypothetical protein